MKITQASVRERADAELLLHEYYEAVAVVKRDSPEEQLAYLADPASALWIAYMEGAAAGCVVLRPLGAIAGAAECKRLFVRPQYRGRGVAEALLNAMEEYARAAGWRWVYLDSKDDLRAALRIYRARGYEACARYNENPQATVFLRKKLDGLGSG